jgi:hypothetical protein
MFPALVLCFWGMGVLANFFAQAGIKLQCSYSAFQVARITDVIHHAWPFKSIFIEKLFDIE